MKKKNKIKEEVKKDPNSITKYLDDIFDFSVWFLFLTPILVYFLLFAITQVVNKYGLFGIVVASQEGWLSFSGSLLGGVMTIFAVIFTIRFELSVIEKERAANDEKELFTQKMSVMPLLKCEIMDKESSYTSMYDRFHFRIRNISNNHAKDIKLVTCVLRWEKPIKSFSDNYELIFADSIPLNENPVNVSLIPSKEDFEFNIWLLEPNDIEVIKKIRNYGYRCVVEMSFRTTDILNLQTRQYVYNLVLLQDNDPHGVQVQGHNYTILKYDSEIHKY